MRKHIRFVCLLFLILPAKTALARGDKVIPQVADGAGFRTKFDLFCPSYRQGTDGYWLMFYKHDGTPWQVETTAGTASQFRIRLAARQTLRVETLGHSNPQVSGYAVLEDRESGNSTYSQDFAIGISVYYEVSSNGNTVDTVSVPVVNPTGAATFPVEIDKANQLLTGIVIVNRYAEPNLISITLFSEDGPQIASTYFTLEVGQHRSEFLNETLFPNLTEFKGTAEVVCQGGPVARIALLQTPTDIGVRYASLVATDKEALRQNSTVFLAEPTNAGEYQPLDVDGFVTDYFTQGDGPGQCCESFPWDLIYVNVSATTRKLQPQNNALVSLLGNLSAIAFDGKSLTNLKTLTYSSSDIDMSDGSPGLAEGFSFAIKTDLGNYAKVRVSRIINTGTGAVHLGLDVYVFR